MRGYLQRVVNDRDVDAVDGLVSPAYVGRGGGWPETIEDLRAFYERQREERPDWHIEVVETVEVAGSVVVRAFAGRPDAHEVEWLAHYRWSEGRITEIDLLELRSV